jgi:hypothetical protein
VAYLGGHLLAKREKESSAGAKGGWRCVPEHALTNLRMHSFKAHELNYAGHVVIAMESDSLDTLSRVP